MQKQFYIGTANKVLALDMPLQDIPATYSKFQEQGSFVMGGNWHYGSANVDKTVELNWPRQDSHGMDVFNSLLFNKYGKGYIYYHDPFAVNILPNYLSLPYRALDYVKTWDRFAEFLDGGLVPSNDYELPMNAVDIACPDDGVLKTFTFVVPDGYSLAISIKGDVDKSTTSFILDWGNATYDLPVSNLDSLWDAVISSDGTSRLASLRVTAPGTLSLYSMMIAVVNEHATTQSVIRKYPKFIVGTGQSGCNLSNETTNTLFSLGQSWEQQPASFVLTETEWSEQ